jgi:hypothetical protein
MHLSLAQDALAERDLDRGEVDRGADIAARTKDKFLLLRASPARGSPPSVIAENPPSDEPISPK